MTNQILLQQNKVAKKNPLVEILCSIVIPTMVLSKGAQWFPQITAVQLLVIALLFPILYSCYEFYLEKKVSFFGVIGLLSVLSTGGLALLQAEGFAMVLKETLFPLLLGLVVLVTSFTSKPLLSAVMLNPQLFRVDLIHEQLKMKALDNDFKKHLKKSTQLFALSFLVSAALNFILAYDIFIPIDASLAADQRQALLNEQVAQMTYRSYFVILVPSMLALIFVMWYFFRGVTALTGLAFKDLMIDQSNINKSK